MRCPTLGPGLASALLLCALSTTSPAQTPAADSRTTALPGTAAGGWPEFRGSPLSTGWSASPAPALKGVKWRYIAESAISNSPSIHEGVVFVGTDHGYVHAVNAKTGEKVWERRAVRPRADDRVGFTLSSPLIRNGRVVLGSEDGMAVGLDEKTGEVRWSYDLKGRTWGSPKTDGSIVMLSNIDGVVVGLDLMTGEPKWKIEINALVGGAPAIVGEEAIFPAEDSVLRWIAIRTGIETGRCTLPGKSVSTPAIALGYAFMATAPGGLTCVDLLTKSERWTAKPFAQNRTCPAVDSDTVYVTAKHTISAWDLKTGHQKWLKFGQKQFYSSPSLVADFVICGGDDKVLRVYAKKDGAELKSFDLGETLISTATVVDGLIYVGGGSGTLFCLE